MERKSKIYQILRRYFEVILKLEKKPKENLSSIGSIY